MTTPRSYYGQPVIKQPTWTPEIPIYLFFGGIAGAGAPLAYLAELNGNERLARRAWPVALAAVSASPALLVSDLGVPKRFLNMLRMFKVTSPMSVGSWILAGSGASISVAAANSLTGAFPRLARLAKPAAALLGPPLATYTGALLAQTSVPVWHEARRELPLLFAGGAAASAGSATLIVSAPRYGGPARRLAVGGAAAELLASYAMERRLGDLGEPYRDGPAAALGRAARALTVAGGLLIAGAGRRRRPASVAGAAMVLGGALCERWSVFRAGFASARDPGYTVGPQRERVRRGEDRGASTSRPAAAAAGEPAAVSAAAP